MMAVRRRKKVHNPIVIRRRSLKRFSCIDCRENKHDGWCEVWGGRCQCQEDGHDLIFDKGQEW